VTRATLPLGECFREETGRETTNEHDVEQMERREPVTSVEIGWGHTVALIVRNALRYIVTFVMLVRY
jgi:hypothetical protein